MTGGGGYKGIQYLQGPDYNTINVLLSSTNSGWPDGNRSIISIGSGASTKFVVTTGYTGNVELRDVSGNLLKSETGYGYSYLQKDSQDRIYAITGSGFNTKITRWSSNLDGKEEFFVIFSQYNGGNEIRFVLRETGSNVEVIMTQYRASSPVFYKTTIPK